MTSQRDRNPLSNEAQLAVVETRLDFLAAQVRDVFTQMKIDHSELMSAVKALEARERERNNQIAELTRYRTANEQRWQEHMTWAEARGIELAEMRRQHHDATVRRSLWKSQWLALVAGAGLMTTVLGILQRLGMF